MEAVLIRMKTKLQECVEVGSSFFVQHQVDIITYATDILVNQPFIVLRRQCQVRGNSHLYHLTPVSLVPVVLVLVQRKGLRVLFQGMYSVIILRTVQFGVEQIVSRYTGWTSTLPPTWYINKDWLLHFLLKSSSLIITAPIYSVTVLNTVAVPFEGITNYRLFQKYDFPLPFWQIMLPTTAYGVLKYAFTQATLSLSSALLYLSHCFDETERDDCLRAKGGIEIKNREDIFLKATVISFLSAEVVFFPLETVVHRLILQGARKFTNDLDCGSSVVEIFSSHDGFFDCCDNIMWLEGKLGLYKGFGALVLQAMCYHYCIKLVSFGWHYIKLYKKFFFGHHTSMSSVEDLPVIVS